MSPTGCNKAMSIKRGKNRPLLNLRNISLSLVAKAPAAPQVNVLSNESVCRQGCTDHLGGGFLGKMLRLPSWGQGGM